MQAAYHKAAPPPLLRLAWQCERYHALPDAGGVLDQDYAIVTEMSILSNVYTTIQHLQNARGHAIHQLGEGQRAVLRALMDAGVKVV